MSYDTDIEKKKQTLKSSKRHDMGSLVRKYAIQRGTKSIGMVAEYKHGQIVSHDWKKGRATAAVWGAILHRWKQLGGAGTTNPIGLPITDELDTPDGKGRFNHFTKGSIYWTFETGAQFVMGAIRSKWSHMGWERGKAGYPLTGEMTTPRPKQYGRYNHFQGGSIYWTPRTGAQWIPKDMFDEWAKHGHERGKMGFPVGIDQAGLGPTLAKSRNFTETEYFEGGYIGRRSNGALEVKVYTDKDWENLRPDVAPFDIEVVYKGFICVEESDWDQGFFGSDEPYFYLSAYDGSGRKPKTEMFGVYGGIDDGTARRDGSSEARRTLLRIRKGDKLTPIAIAVTGHEKDVGDQVLRSKYADYAAKAAGKGAAVLTAKYTGGNKLAVGTVDKIVSSHSQSAAEWVLGVQDDFIGHKVRLFDVPEVIKQVMRNVGNSDRLRTPVNVRVDLRNSSEGDYNIYFHIRRS